MFETDERDVPLDAIKDTYNLEQDEDEAVKEQIRWLEDDIAARGLEHPIKVSESKRRGEYDGIDGKKRRKAVAALYKKGITVRYRGKPLPKGKIRVHMSNLKGMDAALEALCDNADKMRQLTPLEIGRHLVEKVLKGIAPETHEHEEAVVKASKVFHKSKTTLYDYIRVVRKLSPKVQEDKHLTATQKQEISRIDDRTYQERAAQDLQGKDVKATEVTVDTYKEMEEAGIPPGPEEEHQKRADAYAKIKKRLKNEGTNIVNWASSSLFRKACNVTVLSLKRPNCAYRITYISCPRKTLCKKRCKEKDTDIPIEECEAKLSIAAEESIFYAALEKELKSKPSSISVPAPHLITR